MTGYERRRYEMFLRVGDFWEAHRDRFAETSPAHRASAIVADAAAEIEANATAKLLAREEGKKAKAMAREAVTERLLSIAFTARGLARTIPGADSGFHLPKSKSDVALLTAARAFISEGQAHLDTFVQLGLPPTFVTDLQTLVEAFEQASRERRAGRTNLAAAQAGIAATLARGFDAVCTLDVVVSNTLGADPALLAAWKRDRRIETRGRSPSNGRKPTAATPVIPTRDEPDAPHEGTAAAASTDTSGH